MAGMPEFVAFVLWLAFYAAVAVCAGVVFMRMVCADFARVARARRAGLPTQADIDRECDRLVVELDRLDRQIEAMDAASPEDFVRGRWKDAMAARWEGEAQADHAVRLAAEHPGLYRPPPRPADSVRSAVSLREYRLPQWKGPR